MAGAMRLVSIEKGHDPREFAYMPFGGGGGLHACAMMSEVGVTTGIVPRYPGVTSALGCVIADMRHDAVQTINRSVTDLDFDALREQVSALRVTCQARLDTAGVMFDRVSEVLSFDMLYQGQTHTIGVEWRQKTSTQPASKRFRGDLPTRIRSVFGWYFPSGCSTCVTAELVNAPSSTSIYWHRKARGLPRLLGLKRCTSMGSGLVPCRFDRMALPVGHRVAGPAILEQNRHHGLAGARLFKRWSMRSAI